MAVKLAILRRSALTGGIRYFKKRENLRRELREKPCDDSVSHGCAANVAPLQLGEDILWIHSARLDEALVT